MKFRTSRKLKNMILSIKLAILTFFMFLSIFLEHCRVGRYEFLIHFFLECNKNSRIGTKINRVGRVSGNTGICLGLTQHVSLDFRFRIPIKANEGGPRKLRTTLTRHLTYLRDTAIMFCDAAVRYSLRPEMNVILIVKGNSGKNSSSRRPFPL